MTNRTGVTKPIQHARLIIAKVVKWADAIIDEESQVAGIADPDQVKEPDWDDASDDVLKHIHSGATEKLKAQLTTAIAADQRAVTIGGIYVAASMAIAAGLAAVVNKSALEDWPALFSGLVALFLLWLAGSRCIEAAKPAPFMLPGNDPDRWYDDIAEKKVLKVCLGEETHKFNTALNANEVFLRENGGKLYGAMKLGISAPVISFGIWCLLATIQALM